MKKQWQMVLVALVLATGSLYAGKGKIRVAADQQGAYVYVDGKKKAMTGEGFTSILLEEGEHTVKVEKPIDENYVYVQSKKVFVGEDTSTKLTFKLGKILTNVSFTPLMDKNFGDLYGDLSIYNDKLFTTGRNDSRVTKSFIFDRHGNKIHTIIHSPDAELGITHIRYLNDGRRIQSYLYKTNDKYFLKPILISADNKDILEYKNFIAANGTNIDIFKDKVIFSRARYYDEYYDVAWVRDIDTGRLITKITVPKKYDSWSDPVFKFSHDGQFIMFTSKKYLLFFDLKGKLCKKISIKKLNKKYAKGRWFCRGISTINDGRLVLSIHQIDKNILDLLILKDYKVLNKISTKMDSYYPPSVGKEYIAVRTTKGDIEIYNFSGFSITTLEDNLFMGNVKKCKVGNIVYSHTSNTILTRCGIWSF